jgi:hypothetical protein
MLMETYNIQSFFFLQKYNIQSYTSKIGAKEKTVQSRLIELGAAAPVV